jgi:recombination protein RecA
MARKKKVEVQTDNLDIIKKAITKKYGEVISKLSDHEDMIIPTVSTGSISLDVALGRGGMALGRLYEIFGPNSGGKSTLAANVVKQGQLRGMNCCYIDAEHAVDPLLFKGYGVDIKSLDLVQGFNGEENLDILEMLVSSGSYKIAVVDSVSSLIPSNEAASEIGDDHIALLARLMSKATRRLTPIANRAGCLIIFINQLRMKVGGYGNPETTTGGEALAFYTTGRISIRGPEAKARRIPDPLTGEIIGHTTLFEITKNKLAPPFKKTEINLIYGKGYDTHWEVLKLGIDLGIIDKVGAWYTYADNKNFAQGEPNAASYLKSEDNIEMYNEIRSRVVDMVGLTEIYEQNS